MSFRSSRASHVSFWRALVAALVLSGTVTAVADQGAQAKTRKIWARLDMPLAQLLLPTDEVVVAVRNIEAPLFVVPEREPSAKRTLQLATEASNFAAVVKPERIDSALVDNDTWINTRVTNRVVEVLHDRVHHRDAASGVVEIRHDGGELVIDRVIVKTSELPWFEVGKTYLVFLFDEPQNTSPNLHLWYQVLADGTLATYAGRPLAARDGSPGITLPSAAEEVKRWSKKG